MSQVRIIVTAVVYADDAPNDEEMTARSEYVITEEDAQRTRSKARERGLELVPAGRQPGDDAVEMFDAMCADLPDDLERFIRTRVNSL